MICHKCHGPMHVEPARAVGWVEVCNDPCCGGWRWRPTNDPNVMQTRRDITAISPSGVSVGE